MTELPKIVHQRLRAAEAEREAAPAHPEADVLAAFAEQALSPAERENVLGHLALCADCRDAVLLALPAEELAAAAPVQAEVAEARTEAARDPVSAGPSRSWFSWADFRFSNLRWAALAAGVAVALFVLHAGLGHLGRPSSPATVASRTAASAGSAAPTAQVASEQAPQKALEAKSSKTASPEIPSRRERTSVSKPSAGLEHALIARNRNAQPGVAGSPLSAQAAGSSASNAPGRATETVEVNAATGGAVTTSDSLLAENRIPSIEKAKPALDEAAAGNLTKKDQAMSSAPMALTANGLTAAKALSSTPTLKQGTLWKIAAGVLQRSLDGGQKWQTVLQGEHPWLCYTTHGREIWAGGAAGALQRSRDGGWTWSAVAVSAQDQVLAADVVRIELIDPASVILTTSDHGTWTSADGGKSWEKK